MTNTPEDRASAIDIVVSVLLPFIGLVLAIMATVKRQKRRAITLWVIFAIMVVLITLKFALGQ